MPFCIASFYTCLIKIKDGRVPDCIFKEITWYEQTLEHFAPYFFQTYCVGRGYTGVLVPIVCCEPNFNHRGTSKGIVLYLPFMSYSLFRQCVGGVILVFKV